MFGDRIAGVAVAAAMAGTLLTAAPAWAEDGRWAEKVQVVYDAANRSVSRMTIRVWDPHPEKNLDFTWEPAAGSAAALGESDGMISGRGTLVWRVRGSASYDPRTVLSTYEGDMKNGRPNGEGRLARRSGESFQGTWVDGELDGRGVHIFANGDRYEGDFVAGKAEGQGRFMAATGEIYEGGFRNGLRNGEGTLRLAGGTVYTSRWVDGRDTGGARPDALADAMVGGLLKAQSGGGDAGKATLGLVVDQRMTEQHEIQYQHLVREEDVAVYPVLDWMNNSWNGSGPIAYNYDFDWPDWQKDYAFLQLDMGTTDGSRVRLENLGLHVTQSIAYRKPMLAMVTHDGCVGFRPTFELHNYGWGKAENARLVFHFKNPEQEDAISGDYTLPLGTFDEGVDVSMADIIEQAGVDVATLRDQRFFCDSMDNIDICRAQAMNSIDFGELAAYVGGTYTSLVTNAEGRIEYDWHDDSGNGYHINAEEFSVDIHLAQIEVKDAGAECGDMVDLAPSALRYQEIDLPVNKSDYDVDIPLRGNTNLSSYTARLKISSQMSSYHQFEALANFGDGSVRRSKPVTLFYFKPRKPNFVSQEKLPACYLDTETGGSC